MKILFIGTGQFGSYILKKLAQTNFKPDFLICAHDKPVGRKQEICACPAKQVAKENNLEIIEFQSLKGKSDFFKNLAPDIIIVADTNFYLPQEILKIPKFNCLNIHPSLLPKYRGPSPIQTSLLEGGDLGVTIIQMTEEIDAGPVLTQKKLPTEPDKLTHPEAKERIAHLGADLLIKILPDWFNKKITLSKQNNKEATLTKFLSKKDGLINWNKTALEVDRKVRALMPWPGTYTFFKKNDTKVRLQVLKAHSQEYKANKEVGDIIQLKDNELGVVCKKNILVLEKVKPAGKNVMTGKSFLNGYNNVKSFI